MTYTVVAAAKNDDLLLFPGMTAKADIIIGDKPDALQVPSAALRFRPQGLPQPSGSHVWVSAGSSIRPVSVRVGVSTEGRTEIIGDVSEGEAVAVGDGANVASPAVWAKGTGWMEPLHVALAALVNR